MLPVHPGDVEDGTLCMTVFIQANKQTKKEKKNPLIQEVFFFFTSCTGWHSLLHAPSGKALPSFLLQLTVGLGKPEVTQANLDRGEGAWPVRILTSTSFPPPVITRT